MVFVKENRFSCGNTLLESRMCSQRQQVELWAVAKIVRLGGLKTFFESVCEFLWTKLSLYTISDETNRLKEDKQEHTNTLKPRGTVLEERGTGEEGGAL